MRKRLAFLVPALLAATSIQAQQQPAHPKVDQEKVDEAIQKGCKWLLVAGNGFATFNHGMRNQPAAVQAYGELVLLTLLHSGYYTEESPEIQPLIRHVNEKIIGSTYTAALMAMALTKLNARKYQERIAVCAQFLCDNQCENGQWDYGEPLVDPPKTTYDLPKRPKKPEPETVATGDSDPNAPKPPVDPKPAGAAGKTQVEKKGAKTTAMPRIPVRKRKPGPPNGDNSNSQYAALGLRACMDASIDVDPAVLQRARQWWLKNQHGDGGWGYNDRGDTGGTTNDTGVSNDSYGSMTVGATGALCIYDYYMGLPFKTDTAVIKGAEWIGKNFDVTKNPKKTSFAYLYYLYGLERAGMLVGVEKFGQFEWYPDGANHLLSTQTAAGTWGGTDSFPKEVNIDTCFAILFLRRGTAPLKPPAPVATGDPGPGRAPVANGTPVPNAGGGNRDPGLVANKNVEPVAPGWYLANCGPDFQKIVSARGKENVLQTSEEGTAKQPTLRKRLDLSTGQSLKLTVGHLENDSWTLKVLLDSKEIASKGVSDQTSTGGWMDIVVDLNEYAGKNVLIELVSVSGDAALWASVSVGN